MANPLAHVFRGITPKKVGSDYEYLGRKWSKRHGSLQSEFQKKHGNAFKWLKENVSGEQLALGSLGGLMLLAVPSVSHLASNATVEVPGLVTNRTGKETVYLAAVLERLPKQIGPLSPDVERDITEILTREYGFKIAAEIDGKRLNADYGLMGVEQHLYRYPGDNLESHLVTDEDRKLYERFGVAPGLGAWGYFAKSAQDLSQQDIVRERYYVVAQTFLSPGFSANAKDYANFFKYRKVLVLNPETGQSVVADIGDAGPAPWTGKSFGGSPEVMHYLGLVSGSQKGAVLFFFIDDPSDKIPLGPIGVI